MMDCIIIEDQAPAQRVLKKYIADMGALKLKGTFSNAIDAMEFLKTERADLIFLDIHLPKISGMDFLKTLRGDAPAVILTTAFSDYAVESYELEVTDYLVKPFSFERFVQAVSRVRKNTVADDTATADKDFFIKSGYEYIRINGKEVLFICSDMDYTELHLAGRKYLSPETLQYWEQKMNDLFVRVHKSYLVNISFIKKVAGNQIYLSENVTVPLGRAYKDGFLSKYVK
ncbi:MAG: LytR/AlgR family response regulator transcription factor [Owenweeksia sp.]